MKAIHSSRHNFLKVFCMATLCVRILGERMVNWLRIILGNIGAFVIN